MSDPRTLAMEYLSKNKIPEIFEILGSKLAILKPSDPNAFIIEELSKMTATKKRGESITLFDEADIKTLFSVFDLTGRGFVSKTQYMRALNYVGIDNPTTEMTLEQLDEMTFCKSIMNEIQKRAII